jgi:hypothetical protein
MPAAVAVRRRRAWYVQTLSTLPIRYIPCCSVRGRRAGALPRRVSDATRSRNVAWSRARSAVLSPPCPGERRLRVSTRVGVPSTRRCSRSTTRRGPERFTTWARSRWRQGPSRGRPGAPVRTGARQVSRSARTEADQPSVPSPSGAGAAPRRPRSRSRRLRGLSRGARTAPASPSRVLTRIASALPTMPPGVLTRIAAAGT